MPLDQTAPTGPQPRARRDDAPARFPCRRQPRAAFELRIPSQRCPIGCRLFCIECRCSLDLLRGLNATNRKGYVTPGSRVIPDLSTDGACGCLTSQIGRDVVLSTKYGRTHRVKSMSSERARGARPTRADQVRRAGNSPGRAIVAHSLCNTMQTEVMRVTLCHLSTWNGAEHMGLLERCAPTAAVTFPLLINSVKRTKVTRVGFEPTPAVQITT